MLKTVVGMKDYVFNEAKTLRFLEDTLLSLSKKYNCQEIKTPIVESVEVFTKSLGETSDVVSKEMFTFPDKSGDLLTLRPEGTAGIMRAVLTAGIKQNLPLKFFYSGPMFRYETPQKGRYRQFTQVGVEFLGYDNYLADLECIALAWDYIKALNLEKDCSLEVNSLGDKESREKYKQALVKYLQDYKTLLSKESQERLEKNPLRILDSKSEEDQKVLQKAPRLEDFLSENSKTWFMALKQGLTTWGIPFKENSLLVRGLDYYSETVFEITTDKLGAQSAILAGGRYNDLSKVLGGESISGVGFAAGAERLMMMIPALDKEALKVALVLLDSPKAQEYGLNVLRSLRDAGFSVEVPQNGSLVKKMKKADKLKAQYCVVIGEDEVNNQVVTLKEMSSGIQKQLNLKSLKEELSGKKNS